ncbi:hypothetical protein ABZY20_15200 [Streptomyces sp. NPDC006624]|uniref:hypothetical protein n=1 Tax=unclassified Streptomyces TaxID=2593676 RepID=UPI0033BED482
MVSSAHEGKHRIFQERPQVLSLDSALGDTNRWLDRTPHVERVDEFFAEDAGSTADRTAA